MNFFEKFEKLVIVSNRLSFSVKSDLSFSKSPGGLVSGIENFLKNQGLKIIYGLDGREQI